METGVMKQSGNVRGAFRSYRWIIPGVAVLALLLAGALTLRWIGSWFDAPAPQTIAQASLESMREQQRLTTLSARYVAVVTSSQDRLGGFVRAQKTMIMPGEVRYDLDLSKLTQEDVRWNESSKTLSVTLPPIEISRPQIDIDAIQEYSEGGIAMALTDAETTLDSANREAAQRSLVEQARGAMPMRAARESARRAVERSFALPLRAAGIDAQVEVRFADEPQPGVREYMDASTPLNTVMGRPVIVNEK